MHLMTYCMVNLQGEAYEMQVLSSPPTSGRRSTRMTITDPEYSTRKRKKRADRMSVSEVIIINLYLKSFNAVYLLAFSRSWISREWYTTAETTRRIRMLLFMYVCCEYLNFTKSILKLITNHFRIRKPLVVKLLRNPAHFNSRIHPTLN